MDDNHISATQKCYQSYCNHFNSHADEWGSLKMPTWEYLSQDMKDYWLTEMTSYVQAWTKASQEWETLRN